MTYSGVICSQCEHDFTQSIINYIGYLIEDLEIDESEEVWNNILKKCQIAFEMYTPTRERIGED